MGVLHAYKWLLRKPFAWFRNKITRQLQEQLHVLEQTVCEQEKQNHMRRLEIEQEIGMVKKISEKQTELLEIQMEEAGKKIEKAAKDQAICFEQIQEMQEQMRAAAREIMLAKWMVIDVSNNEKGSDLLTCRICGYSQRRDAYERKESDCIFYGGHLVRYVCPKCGVIFGPTKFMDREQMKIDEDYQVHYIGFSEGDSSEKEEKAFFMLQPSKEGVYLNYGCGKWSNSLQNLRKQGYQVFGYEPYAPDTNHPYMITNKETLKKMRFDGIYSNDVLEHLLYPVQELEFMSNLFTDSNSKMAHSTACYIYKYEYTRFHTHFFTGDSVSAMCEASGLRIVAACNEIENHDFICYVFAPANRSHNMLENMYIKHDGIRNETGTVTLFRNGILYGPYLNLFARNYCLEIELQGEVLLKITANCGQNLHGMYELHTGIHQIPFVLSDRQEDVEFVIENKTDRVRIDALRLI